MKSPRLGFVILVLSLVFAGAYLATNVFKHPRKIATQQIPLIKLSSPKQEFFSSENFDKKINLTESLGKNVFEEIKKQTETNPDFFSSVPDINTLSQKIIKNSLENNKFLFTQSINETDLKISQDNSKETIIKYLAAINEIAQARMGNFNKNYLEVLSSIVKKNDFPLAGRFADINKNIANDYLKLTVPSNWIDIHKKLITHFKNSEIVFQAISDYSKDPINAYLAVQMIDQLETEVKKNKNNLYQKMSEIEL